MVPSIPHHGIEDLDLINTSDNAPQSLYTTTAVGFCLRSRFAASSGMQHQPRDITTRRRVIQGDAAGPEQLRRFQIETETAETESQAERRRPTLSSRRHSCRPRWRTCRQEHQWPRRHWPAPVNGSTPCIGNQHRHQQVATAPHEYGAHRQPETWQHLCNCPTHCSSRPQITATTPPREPSPRG